MKIDIGGEEYDFDIILDANFEDPGKLRFGDLITWHNGRFKTKAMNGHGVYVKNLTTDYMNVFSFEDNSGELRLPPFTVELSVDAGKWRDVWEGYVPWATFGDPDVSLQGCSFTYSSDVQSPRSSTGPIDEPIKIYARSLGDDYDPEDNVNIEERLRGYA